MRAAAATAAGVLLAALSALGLLACGGRDESDLGSLPPLPPEPLLGFNETIRAGGRGNELLADSGASFARVPLSWAAVEPQEGERDFSGPDRIAEELASYGLRPLWVVTSAPCWAGALPCEEQRVSLAPAPDRLDEYAGFAVEVAERYPEAIGIEVWNEPNIPNFWRPAPDAEVYRELLATTADAVHESGSQVPVVMAGPSPTTQEMAASEPQKIPFVQFIEEVMASPGAPGADAIGTHPYSLLQRDREPVAESIRLFEQARAAARRVAPELPVWVTEIGLSTAGRNSVTPKQQAEGLRAIFVAMERAGVPVITVHRFFDQADPPFTFEEGFGVVADDRSTRKPAFCALAELAGSACRT